MNRIKVIYLSLLLVLPLICMGNTNKHIPLDTVETIIFNDTEYSPDLPAVEIRIGTYHNFYGATTVGYKLILRGEELDIKNALLYKEAPEANITNPVHLLSPFHIHVGDSTNRCRIDHIYIKHKFPFFDSFSENDSLVIVTSKGNFTLYMDEDKRAEARFNPLIESINKELSDAEQNLDRTRGNSLLIIAILIFIFLLSGIIVLVYVKKQQRVKSEQMDKLLLLISENEMSDRHLKTKISDLMHNRFNTINQLCYEYFEKADTTFLKKSIYTKVEEEIELLKSKEQLSELERILNEYCDEIISRITAQIPQITELDKTLLIYLYSGMSARTICVLLDLQLKTFYMRRLRLKNKIESSDAPDKEWFIANM